MDGTILFTRSRKPARTRSETAGSSNGKRTAPHITTTTRASAARITPRAPFSLRFTARTGAPARTAQTSCDTGRKRLRD
eukprot:4694056-Pyramimonas_sp.AAC.1